MLKRSKLGEICPALVRRGGVGRGAHRPHTGGGLATLSA